MKDWNEIEAFYQVGRLGSFTEAARVLRTQKSTLSRRVSALEERLGLPLLRRTTRKVRLTPHGEVYLQQILPFREAIEAVEVSLLTQTQEPEGEVRLGAPVELGHSLLPRYLAKFHQKFPKIKVSIELDDRVVSLVDSKLDFTIRTGPLENSSLRRIKLGEDEFMLFGSKAFAKRVQEVRDLSRMPLILYTPGNEPFEWRLANGIERHWVKGPFAFNVNTLSMAFQLAEAGAGVALLPDFLGEQGVKLGKVVRILSKWSSEKSPFYLVFQPNTPQTTAVKTLIQFFVESFRSAPVLR